MKQIVIEKLAQERVAAGLSRNLDEGIAAVIEENPSIYKDSLTDGKGADSELPPEVKAALATLTPAERAEVNKKATEVFLVNAAYTEADAIAFALQKMPDAHFRVIQAASAAS